MIEGRLPIVIHTGDYRYDYSHPRRLMYGRRYNEGLHQAIEAKEGVKVASENKTLATITFQNFFRLYAKMCIRDSLAAE